MYVSEEYTSKFLSLECVDSDGGCDTIDINCEGDKGIEQERMNDDDDGSYYCNNGGASYCCPFTNCSEFNDPEMGFGSNLTEIDFYLNDVGDGAQIEIFNESAEMLQGSINCISDELCMVRCQGLLSCGFTTISINNSSEVIIECEDTYSCVSMNIVPTHSITNQSIIILCLGMHSMSDHLFFDFSLSLYALCLLLFTWSLHHI